MGKPAASSHQHVWILADVCLQGKSSSTSFDTQQSTYGKGARALSRVSMMLARFAEPDKGCPDGQRQTQRGIHGRIQTSKVGIADTFEEANQSEVSDRTQQ